MQDYGNLQSYSSSSPDPAMSAAFSFLYVAFLILIVISLWKIYTKAGKPGWAAIVPFYNLYVMLQIAGRPGWWLVLFLIPIVNIVISLIVAMDFAKAFGKSSLFGIGLLWLLSFIGYPMLAFGKAEYKGGSNPTTPAAKPPAPPASTPPTPPAPAAPPAAPTA